jgi:hypothetical protein
MENVSEHTNMEEFSHKIRNLNAILVDIIQYFSS